MPQIVPNSCGLSCCSSELAAAPLSLVLDAVGRRKRLCRGQGGQGGLPFFLLGFWVSCCSVVMLILLQVVALSPLLVFLLLIALLMLLRFLLL